MAGVGLVASVEAQLERTIGSGMLHPSGQLPSEQMLARRYGVCRSTLREALRRLAARGLVVQHPGRKTRVVALDEAVTLENLGVALHGRDGTSSLDRRQLLEGYFALKREATVDEADAVALKRELPLLLRACDERLLERLAPVREADDKAPCRAVEQPSHMEAEPARGALSGSAVPNLSDKQTGSCGVAPEAASAPGPALTDSCRQPEHSLPAGPGAPPGGQSASSATVRERCEWRQGLPCALHLEGEGVAPCAWPRPACRASG
jgi:transposase-like protein